MNAQDSKAEIFDVFLCHNSVDKPVVRQIALELSKEGIKPWLDEDQIRPGTSWQTALGEQIESINSAAVFVGDAGLGPWQNQESQALLNQFVKRGCPVIPVVLASATTAPDVPWMFANLHCVDFRTDSQPLQRLVWGITGKKPAGLASVSFSSKPPTMQERAPRLIAGGDEEARSDNVISGVRLYPPLAEPPDPDNTTQLNILRRRVSEYWVDGVLKHSLYNEVLISLGKREVGNAIDAPWKYTVEVADVADSTPLDDRDVSVIYDATGLLLILGEPGSGKTTTLLDLARILLERAKDDIKERIPVVVNLSSWKKKQSLEEWISVELSEKYRVPRKIANFWLQQDYLLPLLDGLDELETALQPDCVAAINTFIDEFSPSGLVICSRLNEYRWLPKRLKLNGAICIEPLSPEEVGKYLAAGGPSLAMLREAIDGDPVLQELAETPLMLSIMSLAYQGAGSDELAKHKGASQEERRKQIFSLYVEQVFRRKGTASLVFPKEKIIGWLSWLAGKMKVHSQSVFLVEGLQPSWLDTGIKRVAYRINLTLRTSLICGLLVGLIVGLKAGPTFGLIFGLFFGLFLGLFDAVFYGIFRLIGGSEASWLGNIALVETINWKWNKFWKVTIPATILDVILLLVPGLMVGLMFGLTFGLIGGLIGGAISILLIGLTKGLVFGFTGSAMVEKVSPNQGVQLSLKNSAVVFLVISLTIGLSGGLLVGLLVGLIRGFDLGVSYGLIAGLIPGVVGGLDRGGSAVINHYTLRSTLWLSGDTPFRLVKFLDECSKLILLKKVGGGYIFIHRMLLDYFADLKPQSTKGRKAKSASP